MTSRADYRQTVGCSFRYSSSIYGVVSVGNHKTQWHFHPRHVWADDRITIVVDSELENVAGNNFQNLLDHSVKAETKKLASISISLDLKFWVDITTIAP